MWKNIRMMGIVLSGAILLTLYVKGAYMSEETMSVGPTPLLGKKIALDPGHGGYDGGAIAKDKTNEKGIALAIAKETRTLLEQAGATVYMTREGDTDLVEEGIKTNKKGSDIRNRLRFIHESGAQIFLSIHLNALTDTQWRGAQTFYSNRYIKSEKLASAVQSELIRNLENTTRKALEINHIYLLKNADIPGVLVEVGFLSNETERELLKDPAYQRKIAASIYKGILLYIEEMDSKD